MRKSLLLLVFAGLGCLSALAWIAHETAGDRRALNAAITGPAATSPTAASPTAVGIAGTSKTRTSAATAEPSPASDVSLFFEPNQGQVDPRVEFVSRGRDYSLFMTSSEAVLVTARGNQAANTRGEPSSARNAEPPAAPDADQLVVRLRFLGANPDPEIIGLGELPGRSNYFRGDKGNWRTGIPHFARLRYEEIYPGIDVVFYGNDGSLEYDFVVGAGADPADIRLAFEGARRMVLNEPGDLVIELEGGGEMVQHAPEVYQLQQGGGGYGQPIRGAYRILGGNRIGFELGPYDRNRPVTIDPVLTFSTYLGGTSSDEGASVAVDTEGHLYVVGTTESTDFPTSRPMDSGLSGSMDIFVAKFDMTGPTLLYSTYVGGSDAEEAHAVAADEHGTAYVTGYTSSSDFPTRNAYDKEIGGDSDAFVFRLKPAGDALLYSTYLGGVDGIETGFGIDLNSAGVTFVTGTTSSSDFPTTFPSFPALNGRSDAFIVGLGPGGAGLVLSRMFGGSGDELGYAIEVDDPNGLWVTGKTTSTDLPVVNPTQASSGGLEDAFVFKHENPGMVISYLSYLGGSGDDLGNGIALSPHGTLYVSGETQSPNFPTTNPLDSSLGGASDAFLRAMNPIGAVPLFSTYLGGSGDDVGVGLAVDRSGYPYVTGQTHSSDFPTVRPLDGTLNGVNDAFLTVMSPTGDSIIQSTYLGGSGWEYPGELNFGGGIALDAAGAIYLTGRTASADFPTLQAVQPTYQNGGSDAFLTVFSPALDFFIASTRGETPAAPLSRELK
jgi:hypothetical protein